MALWLAADPAFAAACSTPAPPTPRVSELKGVRTKWLSFSPDKRNSLAPDLAHLSLSKWMGYLQQSGVNLAEINLEPQRLLANQPTVSDADLMQGAAASAASGSQPDARFANDIIPLHKYTPAQRNAVLLNFLRQLEDLRQRGEIPGSIRILIHQRLWLPKEAPAQGHELRAEQFSDDMASFINLAEQNCLGHWLAGIRWGEKNNNDMNQLLPAIIRLAKGVNAATGGWLKTHLFVVDGGGMGAEYRGITSVRETNGQPYPFFPAIAQETGAFTFGYKFENLRRDNNGIGGNMRLAQCEPNRRCNADSAADWETFLGQIYGFDELTAYLAANHAQYPAHANVVFVGDITDAAVNLVHLGPNGTLEDRPAMTALRHLFVKAGPMATSGKIFMNAFNTDANIREQNYNNGNQVVDIGRAFYFVSNDGNARLLPQSYRIWKNWPQQ